MDEHIPQPPSKGRSVWKAAVPPLLHILIQIVVCVPVYLVLMAPAISELTNEYLRTGVMPQYDPLELLDPGAFVISLFISGLISICIFRYQAKKAGFISQPSVPAHFIFAAVVVSIACNFALTSGISFLQELLGTDIPTSTISDSMLEANPNMLLLAVCIVGPVAEEYCFRALSLGHLMRRFTFWQANVLQAAFFGIIHLNIWQIFYAFLFGLFLGWIYFKTGRFAFAVTAHIAFNSSGILLGLIPSADKLMESPSGLVLCLFLPSAAVLTVGIAYINRAVGKTGG